MRPASPRIRKPLVGSMVIETDSAAGIPSEYAPSAVPVHVCRVVTRFCFFLRHNSHRCIDIHLYSENEDQLSVHSICDSVFFDLDATCCCLTSVASFNASLPGLRCQAGVHRRTAKRFQFDIDAYRLHLQHACQSDLPAIPAIAIKATSCLRSTRL